MLVPFVSLLANFFFPSTQLSIHLLYTNKTTYCRRLEYIALCAMTLWVSENNYLLMCMNSHQRGGDTLCDLSTSKNTAPINPKGSFPYQWFYSLVLLSPSDDLWPLSERTKGCKPWKQQFKVHRVWLGHMLGVWMGLGVCGTHMCLY